MKRWGLVLSCMLLTGCLGMPDGMQPVQNFERDRYLGTWYEIARLDHSFERGLSRVSATYSLRDDGGIRVINRGYNAEQSRWSESEGKAYFVEDPQQAYLKVSFFGPFYGSYVVFGLDQQDYQYAFVAGPDTDYLWLLARTPTVEHVVIDEFIAMAKQHGFATDKLIWVSHD